MPKAFAARAPEIAAAANKAARDKLIKALAAADADTPERRLHEAFAFAKRAVASCRPPCSGHFGTSPVERSASDGQSKHNRATP